MKYFDARVQPSHVDTGFLLCSRFCQGEVSITLPCYISPFFGLKNRQRQKSLDRSISILFVVGESKLYFWSTASFFLFPCMCLTTPQRTLEICSWISMVATINDAMRIEIYI